MGGRFFLFPSLRRQGKEGGRGQGKGVQSGPRIARFSGYFELDGALDEDVVCDVVVWDSHG